MFAGLRLVEEVLPRWKIGRADPRVADKRRLCSYERHTNHANESGRAYELAEKEG